MFFENELLAGLVQLYEIGAFWVDDGFLGRLSCGVRVHIEANHATDHVHANLHLPDLGRSLKRDLSAAFTVRQVKLEHKLRVGDPGEFLRHLLKRLIAEMAARQ